MSDSAKRLLLGGWFQQLAASGSLFLFNIFAASLVGLTAFGDFAGASALTGLCSSVLLGGFDVSALRIGNAGAVDRVALRLLVQRKLPALLLLGAVIYFLGPNLFPRATNPVSLALAAALLLVAQGMSSLLINAIIGARLAYHAVSLSAVHGLMHLAVPFTIANAPSGESLTTALSLTYFVAVGLELAVLRTIPHLASSSPIPSVGALLSGAAPTWFDAARSGGAQYLGSLVLPPAQLAVGRLLLGLQQGVASLVPISQTAVTALAHVHEDDEAYQEMVGTTTSAASAIAAAGAAAGTAVLGMLAYRSESELLSRMAPAAAVGAAITVLLRFCIGMAAGLRAPIALAKVLIVPTLCAALLPTLAAATSGLLGFVFVGALAPGLALFQLDLKRAGRLPASTLLGLGAVVLIAFRVPEIGKALGSPALAAVLAAAASILFAGGLWWAGALPVLRGPGGSGRRT